MDLIFSSTIACAPRDDGRPTLAIGKLSSNENYISFAISDGSLHVFSAVDGSHKLRVVDPLNQWIWAHILVDDMVIFGSKDGVLRTWNIPERKLLYELEPIVVKAHDDHPLDDDPAHIRHLHCLSSFPHSVLVVTISGSIHQWEIGAAGYQRTFLQNDYDIFDIQSYENGTRFITIAPDERTIAAWDVNTGFMLWQKIHHSEPFSFVISNGKAILGLHDGQIKILRLEDGSEITAFRAHSSRICQLALYNDLLISTGGEGYAKVWSMLPSNGSFKIERSERLHDLAVVARGLLGPWLVTGGKIGGEEGNTCGLGCEMKLWQVQRDDGVEPRPAEEIGLPVVVIWSMTTLSSRGLIAVSLLKKGKPVLDIWKMRSSHS